MIDAHSHLENEAFDDDREEIIARMEEDGLDAVVNVGSDIETSRAVADLAKKHDRLYAVVGVHPQEAKYYDDAVRAELVELAKDEKVLAIGECGLDYYYENSPRDVQRNVFRAMCELAAEVDLPLVIHSRDAAEETYDIVFGSQEWQDLDRGIITREEANKIMLEKAAHANRVFEVQTCLDEWFTMLETNKTTVQIMRKLKAAGYRLYYLTNIPTDVMDELRQREWFSLFDGGIASCDVHLCKPEPEIFTTLMQTCHLAYDESIFVDDNKANAQAAYNLGITGILYKNPKSFTRALGACGIEVE